MKSPDKPNIVYSVYEKEKELEDLFAPLVEELRLKRTQMPKVIIFCRTYNDCSHLFLYFKDRLGKEITDPVGYPSIPRFRIVDMFTACNTTGVKASILSSFCANHSHLRLVIATVAFGMGIDCPNVQKIIHWSPPSDVEMYIQETGRAGRDGTTAYATLFYSRKGYFHDFH